MRLLAIAVALVPAVANAQSSGTGFFVGPNGMILTSRHVVADADRITCRTAAGDTLPARVLRSSEANDLAVLQVQYRPVRYLGLAPVGSLRIGQRIFTIGFPLVDMLGSEPRFTEGTVSALSYAGEDNFVQVSIPVQPGNSGGPIVNENGQVVGILAATARYDEFLRRTGTLPQNISWGIKADYAVSLLGGPMSAPKRTRDEAIELVRQSLCFIQATRTVGYTAAEKPDVPTPASAPTASSEIADVQTAGTIFGQCVQSGVMGVPPTVSPEAGAATVLNSCSSQRRALEQAANVLIATLPEAQRPLAQEQLRTQIAGIPAQIAVGIQQMRAGRRAAH